LLESSAMTPKSLPPGSTACCPRPHIQ
jgi:hypothetical protein